MNAHLSLSEIEAQANHMWQRRVVRCLENGSVVVAAADLESGDVVCNPLVTSEAGALQLAPDDVVLVWVPSDDVDYGVILGRIGPTHSPTQSEHGHDDTPDELILEAKHSLTLRVGAGSITIREDGKILIKGKDLVSHAQRLNRIKGGAVQIN